MNLTEQIKVFQTLDLKSNKRNSKAINRLLNEATLMKSSNLNSINQDSKERKESPTSKRLEELKIITERYKFPKLEQTSDEKFKSKVNFDQPRKITRVNLYGYESIQEEPFPVIKRLSPKQKEEHKKIQFSKQPLESLIKKPSLKSLRFNNDKKGIIFKDDLKVNAEKNTSIKVNQPVESIQLNDKPKELNVTISSSMSEDANYAMLKTYEDMIYLDLLSIYPESESLSRTKTKDFIQIPRKLPTILPPLNSRLSERTEQDEEDQMKQSQMKNHQIKISQHLEKVPICCLHYF